MVGDSCNLSTGGGQGKGRRVQGHSQLQSKSEDSLSFQSSCLKYTELVRVLSREEWLLPSFEYKPQERTNFCKLSFSLETDYIAYTASSTQINAYINK